MKLNNITKIYHNKNNEVCVFKDLNLTFPDRGCITVYGESGSGKTTLFRLIAGLDKDYEGIIENNDRVEYLYQETMLFENLSVYDNLLFSTRDLSEIDELLNKFELTELKNQRVKKLSAGEKRRVQIIRSLLNHPSLLLMDEPSASLDQKNAALICGIIKQLSKELTVVITTHDEELFDNVADISYRIKNQQLILLKNNEIKPMNESTEHLSEKGDRKSKSSIFKISKLYMKAHKTNFLMCVILLLIFSFSAYIGFFYHDSSGAKQKQNIWNYSTNLIYTFPNTCEEIISEGSNYVIKQCENFDLFNLDALNQVIDKNDDIIAYALEWNSETYLGFDYQSMEQMEKDMNKGKEFSPKEQLQRSFYSYYDVFQIIEHEEGAAFVNPETSYIELIDIGNKLKRHGNSSRVFPYEMIDMNQLPLICGAYPKKNDEAVIGNDLAQALTEAFDYENAEQLIGKQLAFSTRGDVDILKGFLPDEWGEKDLNLHITVSGITAYENVFENRIYFNRNAFQTLLADIYHYDINKLNVQAEKFLIDPSKEAQEVLTEISFNSPLKLDSYHIFNGEDNVYIEWNGKINQDQGIMKRIIAILFILCIMLLLLHRFFLKKQLKKESQIMKQCGYSPIKIESLVNLYLLLITGILSLLLMAIWIPLFNHVALFLFHRTLLAWSFKDYIYSYAFICILYEAGTALYLKYLTRS